MTPARGLGLLLAAALIATLAVVVVGNSSTWRARYEAGAAFRSLQEGDLAAVEKRLAEHRGDADFAYYFTSKTTPRVLGDALSTVAGTSKDTPLKAGVDPHQFELTLTDLAGTLALATHGTGDRALSRRWTKDFITGTTEPSDLYPVKGDIKDEISFYRTEAEKRRDQDRANKSSLLLLLSRGYWSAEFLQQVTAGYYTFDREAGDAAWPAAAPDNEVRYAPAPSGAYLTDGVLALTAALTANPQASAWAFTDFKPGTKDIDGTNYEVGRFTHYLLFEHRYASTAERGSVGMTAVLTALSSAVGATDGATVRASTASSDLSGPRRDSIALEALSKDLSEDRGCSWAPRTYWNCAKAIAKAVLHWLDRWGHLVLDILAGVTVVALFIGLSPEIVTGAVIVGTTAAAIGTAWYLIDGDYEAAGLSFAAVVAGPVFKPLAEAMDASASALKAASQLDEIGEASSAASQATKAAEVSKRARNGAAKVVKGSQTHGGEKEFERKFSEELAGSTTQKYFQDPDCTQTCRHDYRILDVFHKKTGTLFELKVGANNKPHMRGQIERDVKLRASGLPDAKRVVYVFARKSKDGTIFPDDDVRLWLKAAKIPYVICEGEVESCVKAAMKAA